MTNANSMELTTVNLDGVLLDVYYEIENEDIVIKSVEFLRKTENLLPSLSKGSISKIIDILNEDIENNICHACNGSGEGQYDGTRCNSCKGLRVI